MGQGMHRLGRAAALILMASAAASCSSDHANAENERVVSAAHTSPLALPGVDDSAPREYPGIHNAVAFHDGFVSGSAPEGDAGFDSLQRLGFKTIISVDGATPDVQKAESRGIRYIHLPIGYNGFDEQRKLELVRATRDALANGPVYIHCHHGKHRSAGAAAAIAASMGWASPESGVARMKVAGTAANYPGLYACAANAGVIAMSVINAVPDSFPSVSTPSNFVQGMVDIDAALENLKAIERAGWVTPADHPDLLPAAEAGRLADLLRLLAAGERTRQKPPQFASMLLENHAHAQRLEDLLASKHPSEASALSQQLKLVVTSCKDCHATFRD